MTHPILLEAQAQRLEWEKVEGDRPIEFCSTGHCTLTLKLSDKKDYVKMKLKSYSPHVMFAYEQ